MLRWVVALPNSMKVLFFLWFALVGLFAGLLWEESQGDVHKSRSANEKEGFWGNPTSNIDWCEDNYQLSPYVAEFWNALSSFSFVASSMLGTWLTLKYRLEKRFIFCFLSVGIVGCGSVLFHSTLLRFTQSLDELPMIFSALIFIYIIHTMNDPNEGTEASELRKKQIGAILSLIGFAIFVIYSIFPENPIVFQGIYVGLVCYVTWKSIRMYKKCQIQEAKYLLETAMVFCLLGSFLWLVEPKLCSSVGWLNLHAWWHVLICCGIYLEILFFKYIRLSALGFRPSILPMKPTLLPYIHCHMAKIA